MARRTTEARCAAVAGRRRAWARSEARRAAKVGAVSLWFPRRSRPGLNLALQGGGSHGAFTWGVLDALLEADAFEWPLASGASAGALNASLLACGLAQEREGAPRGTARQVLRGFWEQLARQAQPGWMAGGSAVAPKLSAMAQWALSWTHWVSPAQFNPLDHNPLRELLVAHIDFALLRRATPLRLLIAATRADSGRLRLFHEHELTLDMLLASACLPMLHHPVMLDGQAYWDGGYAANPPLRALLESPHAAPDTLIVPLSPRARPAVPKLAPEIRHRLAELAFNAPFVAELAWLDEQQRALGWPVIGRLERRIARARWHVVDGAAVLAPLAGETRLIAQPDFVDHLHRLGRHCAQQWLREQADQVGRRSTAALGELLKAPPEPAA
ncbi:MAG: patatin-like phospholipase family protein [Rubrivivax sp.]|nr:patatin-like phospholipase family protein [Rubrivivax sp.]